VDDIYQVAFYASNALNCQQAVLVYPQPLARPLNDRYQNIWVRSLSFTLVDKIEQAGQQFLTTIFLKN
jgi:5-methylcytosine-specific restriction enzyme subunit McrC